jgi:hypothetical protein
MSIRKAIRQIEALTPGAYAIVFNHRLEAAELNELKEICQKVNIKALLLTDARVVPLSQVFAVVGNTNEVEIAKALEAKGETVPLPDVQVSSQWDADTKDVPYKMTTSSTGVELDVTESQPEPRHDWNGA